MEYVQGKGRCKKCSVASAPTHARNVWCDCLCLTESTKAFGQACKVPSLAIASTIQVLHNLLCSAI
jgi:hypothetical protein